MAKVSPDHPVSLYLMVKLRPDAVNIPWKQYATMAQLDIHYWEHCGHDRTEVSSEEIVAFYCELGWAFKKFTTQVQEQQRA